MIGYDVVIAKRCRQRDLSAKFYAIANVSVYGAVGDIREYCVGTRHIYSHTAALGNNAMVYLRRSGDVDAGANAIMHVAERKLDAPLLRVRASYQRVLRVRSSLCVRTENLAKLCIGGATVTRSAI